MTGRVTWRGVTLDARSAAMMTAVADHTEFYVRPVQGCYNTSVSASAGTHSGPGAIDVSVRGLTTRQRLRLVNVMRRVGWAAWLRTSDEGPWGDHVHGIAVGCRGLPPIAARQVAALRRGRNGLANNGLDRHRGMHLDVTTWEDWLRRNRRPDHPGKPAPEHGGSPQRVTDDHDLGSRDLRRGDRGTDVATLQRFLGITDDGWYGPATERAVRRYQGMRGLIVDGWVGRQTFAPIRAALGLR